MHVPEITKVKNHLESLKDQGLIASWELPYENILTRISAAIFFVTPAGAQVADEIWDSMSVFENFACRENTEKTLSKLQYRVTFNEEEKMQPASTPLS